MKCHFSYLVIINFLDFHLCSWLCNFLSNISTLSPATFLFSSNDCPARTSETFDFSSINLSLAECLEEELFLDDIFLEGNADLFDNLPLVLFSYNQLLIFVLKLQTFLSISGEPLFFLVLIKTVYVIMESA